MKYVFTFLCALFFVSCLQEEINTPATLLEGFSGAKIPCQYNNGLQVNVAEQELLNAFNQHAAETGLNKTAISCEVFNYGESHYLRFHNNDGSGSNVALIKDASSASRGADGTVVQNFTIGTTTCTSKACASCCGCLPKEGGGCTKCTTGDKDCDDGSGSGPVIQ